MSTSCTFISTRCSMARCWRACRLRFSVASDADPPDPNAHTSGGSTACAAVSNIGNVRRSSSRPSVFSLPAGRPAGSSATGQAPQHAALKKPASVQLDAFVGVLGRRRDWRIGTHIDPQQIRVDRGSLGAAVDGPASPRSGDRPCHQAALGRRGPRASTSRRTHGSRHVRDAARTTPHPGQELLAYPSRSPESSVYA